MHIPAILCLHQCVDVMRWMYASQNPEHNLLFGYGHGNEVRKKLIQLWNSYSFFATYAAVDGFNPAESNVIQTDLNVMDQWILSKLHAFIRDSRTALDGFRSDQMMKKFEAFLEELSNWYIRRSRRRFWKSEDDKDKQAAYRVLYEVLSSVIKVMAPILPFVTEKIYQNLVCNLIKDAPESIHLCDYPNADESKINMALIEKVDSLRRVVELGRSARNKANLKIRQPLAELGFTVKEDSVADFILDQQHVVMDELNVKLIRRSDLETDLIRSSTAKLAFFRMVCTCLITSLTIPSFTNSSVNFVVKPTVTLSSPDAVNPSADSLSMIKSSRTMDISPSSNCIL